ncbi:MAG: HAMP domain-containing protein [Nitrospiraceae bacterium]|nr:HAMP domain-containing protein [Nitrospiraceae bacterium]
MLKGFFINLSLNKKLILMMLFLSSILTAVLMVLYLQAEKAMFKEFESQISELSRAIQVGVEEITSEKPADEMWLYQYLQSLNTKGVKEISLINNSDEIIASTNLDKVGRPVGDKKKELLIRAEFGESISREEGRGYNLILPVIAGKEHYGYIQLKINANYFSKLLRDNMIKRVAGTLFVFGVGIGIVLLLSWRYTKPIQDVVSAAKRIAAGDLHQTLNETRKDEIGDLTDSFNFMIGKLREQRNMENKLREAEHLSGIGQLSRSIAHEIRNPLNFISLSIDHIKEKYSPARNNDSKQFNSLIENIKKEIHRLNKLIEDFLVYGKPLRLNLKKVQIDSILNDIIEIIWAKAEAENIKIIKNYKSIPVVNIDPELIKTCLFNVILNAFQSMPKGGKLTIKTENIKNMLIIAISDTGMGISADNSQKVFEPFFTTKRNGLGLGLATTKRVIEEHNGKADLQSEINKGTTVIITLPIYQNEAETRIASE